MCTFFFFNDTATTEIYTLSLHDALPIWRLRGRPPAGHGRRRRDRGRAGGGGGDGQAVLPRGRPHPPAARERRAGADPRSEEHTSELQSRQYLVCRLLLEKKKKHTHTITQ